MRLYADLAHASRRATAFFTDVRLIRHGGNKADLDLLRTEFQKANKNNNQAEPTQVEITDRIPS